MERALITEPGKPDYPLPDDFFEVHRVVLEHNGYHIAVTMIPDTHMRKLHDEGPPVLGIPTLGSIYGERLWLYPTPDAAYPVEGIYQPPPKSF